MEAGAGAISQPPQVCFDGLLQFRGLGELGVPFGDEARHLFLEGVAIVFDFLGTDVAAGREDVAVRGDFGGGGGFAEAGNIVILAQRRRGAKRFCFAFFLGVFAAWRETISSPRMIGGGDFPEVGVGQLAMDAVDQGAEFAGVDEEGVFAAVGGALTPSPSPGGRGSSQQGGGWWRCSPGRRC